MTNTDVDPGEGTPDPQEPQAQAASDARAEELARKAAAFVRAARPRVSRMVDGARPRVEQAVDYVRDHEDELKHTAARLARSRIVGPLGLVVDAFTAGASNPSAPPALACPSCAAANPGNARFCNQCGARMTPGDAEQA